MAVKKYLLDTNTIIDYIGGVLPTKASLWLDGIIDSEVAISIINRLEVLSFDPVDPTELIPFEEILATVKIFNITEEVALQTILLRRKYKTKLPDAIIASTALVHDLSLITRNEGDFKKISGLKWLNPYTS